MKFALMSNYDPIAEGSYVFQVKSVRYEKREGNFYIEFATQNGETVDERYNLVDPANGQPNRKVMNVFTMVVRNIMNDRTLAVLEDEKLLVGKFVRADVTHTHGTNRNGAETVYAHIRNITSADGWDNEPVEQDAAESDEVGIPGL